jgi:competence protein ComEA
MPELFDEPPPGVPRPDVDPTWWSRLVDAARAAGVTRAWVVGGAIAVVVVAGALLLRRDPPPPPELTLPMADVAAPTAAETPTTAGEVVVHAAGAVVRPGVYRLPASARVADLVAAAGGSTLDADLDRVNLAAPLVDGERVYVPHLGEDPPAVIDGAGAGGEAGDPAAGPQPIDLNEATVGELETLPGVGPAIAQAIVDYREENGPFSSVDQLLDVPGIGDIKLAEIRSLVQV